MGEYEDELLSFRWDEDGREGLDAEDGDIACYDFIDECESF